MKKVILTALCISSLQAFAQVPEDAIRYSWFPVNGSARVNSIGGAMGSLSGDITAAYVNPAGIGFYNTREVMFGLNLLNQNMRTNYRDSITRTKNNTLLLSPIGVVVGLGNSRDKKNLTSIAFAVNQTASFNRQYRFRGYNNYSSYSEQFAEEFANSGYSIDAVLQSNSPIPYTAAPALYTYLIDTVRQLDGSYQVRAAPENLLDQGHAVLQDFSYETTGGIYELAATVATNKGNKWYFGGTIGIPIVSFNSLTQVTETDTSSVANGFQSFSYKDDFQTTGAGANLKLGAIYRPKDYIRLGLAFHTPTLLYLTDKRNTSLSTVLDGPSYTVNSNTFTNGSPGRASYLQISPWKAMISGSYVFREVQDTRKQRGFLTADIEYVHHRGTSFKSTNEEVTADEKAYYKSLTRVVKDTYKGAFNFRVGGEVKFNVIMARLGFAYYGNPYKDSPEKAYQMQLSGGLGYRNHGMFIDLGYVHHTVRDQQIPYRLEDRLNTYGTLRNTRGQIVATVGFKF
ncbi:MAG: hypothetical protein KF880_11240 [Ferruginibacter sp.]|nr:hypothetical protein [Ferruginibacter sp.]